ncbi:MAG TPA: DUF4157 domain-containing protein, partial [Fimbriimonas sp.]
MAKAPAAKVSVGKAKSGVLQRKCACGGTPGPSGMCAECERKAKLQRKAAGAAPPVPGIVNSVLSSPGRPLEPGTRAAMEPSFGRDLGGVRVHTDARAAESARAVNAHAYTVGDHIVFDHGRYDPNHPAGRRLLAHELAHTVQQAPFQRSPSAPLEISPESSCLEREADSAAEAALAGRPVGPISPSGRTVARQPRVDIAAASDCTDVARTGADYDVAKLQAAGVVKVCTPPGDPSAEPVFVVDKFFLPKEKGPLATKAYLDAAKANQLQATVDAVKEGSGHKQPRDKTKVLRAGWLQKVGWSEKSAPGNWRAAGGANPGQEFYPKAKRNTCHMDHIIELQLYGTNVRENIQVLDGEENTSSGSSINLWLVEKAKKIRSAQKRGRKPKFVSMRFNEVEVEDKRTVDQLANNNTSTPTCLEIECRVVKKGTPGPGQNDAPKGFVEIFLLAGGAKPHKTFIHPTDETHFDEGTAALQNTRQIVAGFLLNTYRHAKPHDQIDAQVDDENLTGRTKHGKGSNKAPISIAITKHPDPVFKAVKQPSDDAKRKLLFASMKDRLLKFHYPWLSEGELTLVQPPEEFAESPDLTGKGVLYPSWPLLNRTKLNLDLGSDALTVQLQAKKDGLPSFGIGRVTEASIEGQLLPEFIVTGSLKAAFWPHMTGALQVRVGERGLEAIGAIELDYPKVAKGRGEVLYRNDRWRGRIDVRPQDIRIPHVTRASLVVDIDDRGIVPSGIVSLSMGGNTVDLKVGVDRTGWYFLGHGKFRVGKFDQVDPIEVDFKYAEGRLSAEGQGGFTWKGMKGTLRIRYEDGALLFGGDLDVTKGRLKGHVSIFGLPSGKWTADGHVLYQLTDELHAGVGLKIDENGLTRLAGELRFNRIRLLNTDFSGERTLYRLPTFKIPVFWIVKFELGSELVLKWGVKPVEVADLVIRAEFGSFDPFSDDPSALALAGSCRIVTGGFVRLSVALTGAFVVDAWLAKAGG